MQWQTSLVSTFVTPPSTPYEILEVYPITQLYCYGWSYIFHQCWKNHCPVAICISSSFCGFFPTRMKMIAVQSTLQDADETKQPLALQRHLTALYIYIYNICVCGISWMLAILKITRRQHAWTYTRNTVILKHTSWLMVCLHLQLYLARKLL